MPRRADPDPPLPVVCTAAEAYAAGLSCDQVRQRVRSGAWRSLARGIYERACALPTVADLHAEGRAEHVRRAVALCQAFSGSSLAVHSAAVGHGLPLFNQLPAEIALNVPLGNWNGIRDGLVIHRMTIPEEDLITLPIPSTSIARTCTDVARLMSFADGLALADAAVRRGLIERQDILAAADRCIDRRRMPRALLVAQHADGSRESPAESGSWAYFLRHRIPMPRMQVELRDDFGTLVARADFLWDEAQLVGECDGRLKYAVVEDVYAEKRREDAIRALGYNVIRWGVTDLIGPTLADRIRRFHTPAS